MPQRTIAPGGGNWNSTTTWVEGAVPTSSDFVVGLATSGNLVINISTATVQYLDLTNYANTISFSVNTNRLNFGSLNAATTTIGSGVLWSVLGIQNGLYKGTATTTYTITQIGTNPIPLLSYQVSGTINLTNDIYLNRYLVSISGAQALNGNNCYIYDNLDVQAPLLGSTIFKIIGSATTINVVDSMVSTVEIDCSGGTATIQSYFNGRNLIHKSGTISNPLIRTTSIRTATPQSFNYDLISGTTWDFQLISNPPANTLINIIKPTTINNLMVCNSDSAAPFFSFDLSGNTWNVNNLFVRNQIVGIGSAYQNIFRIYPGTTVNVNNSIEMLGVSNYLTLTNPTLTFSSTSPGTPATLNVNTNNQYISNASITDINCGGGNKVYGTNLTLSNTTNINNLTFPLPSAETSSVFIS